MPAVRRSELCHCRKVDSANRENMMQVGVRSHPGAGQSGLATSSHILPTAESFFPITDIMNLARFDRFMPYFYRSEPHVSELRRLALESLPACGFQAANRRASGRRAASALAFVAAGFGLVAVSEPLRRIPAKDVIFRDLIPEDRALMTVGAAWKPDGVTAAVASQFVDVPTQTCATGNGESRALVK
jgi:hypothetical protein